MKKIFFAFILFVCISSIGFSLDYWYGDYNIQGTTRRVYFFKDIRSFEEATGKEVGSLKNWTQLDESLNFIIPSHTKAIFNQMIYEGFVAAFFALTPWNDPNYGRMMYEYTFYILPYGRSGTKYTDMPYLNSRINFPR